MKTDNRSKRRRRRVSPRLSFYSVGKRVHPRWVFVAVAALGGCALLAVRNAAQQVDSGWAVATPSPLAKGSSAANPQQQLVIRHILEQTQQPLLHRSTAAVTTPSTPSTADRSKAGLRFAERPEAAALDGWRPAGQSSAPSEEDLSARLAAPMVEATGATGASTNAANPAKQGSGPKVAAETAANANEQSPARLPVASESALPKPVLPVTAERTVADRSATDEPAQDTADDEATPVESSATTRDEGAGNQSNSVTADQPSRQDAKTQSQVASSAPAAKAPATDTAPAKELPPLSRQMVFLRGRVRAVLKGYYRKALNSRDNDPWEVMHGMLAYGIHSRVHSGGPNGELITSVGWLCYNKPCKGQTLLYVTPSGELRAKYGVGLQGHLGQFLAMLAQCHVSPDYPIHVGDHEFTIRDLIEAEKKTCYPKSELTFKLIALQHYADLNDKWVNDQGVDWDFPRLLREEMEQPIRGAACGGTHRLSGLSLAVKTRLRRGEPLDGEYQRAADFVKRYQMYAFRLQNGDGSLSTSWFRGGGDDDDINRRIKTTGHILEWLCYSLSDEELQEPHTIRAVTYLANLMYFNYDNQWETGPMCHAIHALLLYDQRVFEPYDKAGEVATYRPTPSLSRRNQGSNNAARR